MGDSEKEDTSTKDLIDTYYVPGTRDSLVNEREKHPCPGGARVLAERERQSVIIKH